MYKNKKYCIGLLLLAFVYISLGKADAQTAAAAKWGVIDTKGTVVIPFTHDQIKPFTKEGYAIAKKGGKFGLLSKTGKIVIPFEYDKLELYSPEGLVVAQKAGKWGIINTERKIIVPFVHTGLRKINTVEKLIPIMVNNKIQLLDYSGNIKHAPQTIMENYFMIGNGLMAFKKKGVIGYGIINKQGTVIAPAGKYDLADRILDREIVRVSKCTDSYTCKSGVIDGNGKLVIPIEYDDINMYYEQGKDLIATKNNKRGTIDITGKVRIPFQYNVLTYLGDEIYAVSKQEGDEDLHGVVSSDGKVIIPCQYERSTTYFPKDSIGKLKKDFSYALCDHTGKPLTAFDYDEMFDPSNDMIGASKDLKCGFLDKNGKEVIPFIYKEVQQFSEELASVNKEGKWGVIDKNGQEVIKFGTFDVVSPFVNGKAIIAKDKKRGLIDAQGKILIVPKYSSMSSPDGNNLIIAKQ